MSQHLIYGYLMNYVKLKQAAKDRPYINIVMFVGETCRRPYMTLKRGNGMKALIKDEHDDIDGVIDGPEEIIRRLKAYLLAFDKHGHPACWGTKEFVDFLNDVILKDSHEKVIILDRWTNDFDENLPILRNLN